MALFAQQEVPATDGSHLMQSEACCSHLVLRESWLRLVGCQKLMSSSSQRLCAAGLRHSWAKIPTSRCDVDCRHCLSLIFRTRKLCWDFCHESQYWVNGILEPIMTFVVKELMVEANRDLHEWGKFHGNPPNSC